VREGEREREGARGERETGGGGGGGREVANELTRGFFRVIVLPGGPWRRIARQGCLTPASANLE
jgi:hypothetical protein